MTAEAATPSGPACRWADYGWIVEAVEPAGMRLRMRPAAQAMMAGCLLGLLVMVGLFAWFMGVILLGMQRGPPDMIWRIPSTLFSLVIAGIVGLLAVALVLQIVWLLLVREEWEASADRLEIRRRALGFSWGSHFTSGVFLVETNYGLKKEPAWRLAVKSDGRKHYLVSDKGISDRAGFSSTREEVGALAEFLARYTGWPVTLPQEEATAAAGTSADRRELPAELQKRGFRGGVDERLRLTIRPPLAGQLIFGLTVVAVGVAWTIFLADGAESFLRDSDAIQRPLVNFPFLLLLALMLMAGIAAAILGIAVIFARTQWVVDRNLLVVRSRLFGWKSERQFVDAVLHLSRTRTKFDGADQWRWQLALCNGTGQVLTQLRRAPDDDIPRLLAAVLSSATGWPVEETA